MIGLRDINFNIFATTTTDFGDIHFFWEHDDVESRAMELKQEQLLQHLLTFRSKRILLQP